MAAGSGGNAEIWLAWQSRNCTVFGSGGTTLTWLEENNTEVMVGGNVGITEI